MITVLHPGIYTTIQDFGRVGYSIYGISKGGAIDHFSYNLGNTILGNESNKASIEITLGIAKFLFEEETLIAITGANFSPTINNKNVGLNKMLAVNKGDVLSFGKRNFGVYSYVAVKGGVLSEKVLGSRSFFKGITQDTKLNKGEVLPFNFKNDSLLSIQINQGEVNLIFESNTIECYPGPEFDLLDTYQKKLLTQKFSISKECNRIGVVLNEIIPNKLPQIVSSGVLPGTVQLTPSGKLIVLLRDSQTTGGYPRILQLTEQSVSILSQKFTNDYIRFSLLTY